MAKENGEAASSLQLAGLSPAVPDDAAAVADCVTAAYAKYVERIGSEPAPMRADYAALIAKGTVYILRGSDQTRAVLVMKQEDDGILLENIAVHPDYQGQGLGRQLMAFVEERGRGLQLHEVKLYTNEAMTENLAFYARLGYEEIGRRVEDGYRRVYLRKRLE